MEFIDIFNILNTWQFNVIAFLSVVTIYTQNYKTIVDKVKKEAISLVILQLIGGISILALTPFFPLKFSTDIKIYALLFIAIIFYTINDRIHVTTRKNLDVSVSSILGQLSKIFLILYGVLIFKQEIIMSKMFGGLLIFFGIATLLYKKGKFSFNKYVLLAILASFLVATGIVIDVDISTKFNLPIYIMITLVIPALIIFIAERFNTKEVYLEFISSRKKSYLITGISWGLLILFMIRSLQLGESIFIAPLLAVSVFLNVVMAYFVHNERSDFLKKIIVAIIIIIGIYFTVI